MDRETIITVGTFLGAILASIFVSLRTMRTPRKALTDAATRIDETTTRQEAAFALFEKTLTSALTIERSISNEQRAEIAELKKDVGNYKDALDSTLREIDTMRGEMRLMRTEYDTQIKDLRGQIAGLVKELHEKDCQLDALTDAVKKREDMIGDYAQKLDRFERALADKDVQLTEAQTLIGTLKSNELRTADELQQLRERVRNLETQVAKLNAERDTLLNQLSTVTAERDAALRRIDTLEAQLRTLQAAKGEAPPLAERTAAELAVIADMRAEGAA